MEVYGIIYLIIDGTNDKEYVGQTVQLLEKRFNNHVSCKSMLIGKAIRKYGRENFRYGVIKSCASKEEMDYWEKYFIVALHSKPLRLQLHGRRRRHYRLRRHARISRKTLGG